MIRAVIFDLDDTLYREMDYVESGFSKVAAYIEEHHGIDSGSTKDRLLEILARDGRGRVFDEWIREMRLSSSVTPSELVQVYRGHVPSISLYPEVEAELTKLRSSGILLGIITDGCLAVQQMKIRALGLTDLVDDVVCTDAKGDDYAKPNPRVFLDVVERFGLRPRDSVYIGNDSKKDFIGPRAIGMYSAHMSRVPVGEHACDADFHITDLRELDGLLGAID
jgi:putative hydrolase of the HAD superfamily